MKRILAATLLALAALHPDLARADVLPADWCQDGDIGKPCSNAGPKADQPGFCQSTTCTHRGLPCDASSSTPCPPYTYPCAHCELPGGNVAATRPDDKSGSGGAAADGAAPAAKKGWCAVSAVGSSTGGGAAWVWALAMMLTGLRRKR